ncbi:MAG: hypothetical protein P1U88_00510 [Thalassobaculaceae bacterium]|nr:hypothetical protein [Thalassobaculaceae bacterium]
MTIDHEGVAQAGTDDWDRLRPAGLANGADGAPNPAGERRHLVGASLTSAAGSLPTHLLPVTVTAVVAGTSASAESVGWIASALLLGQLLSSTGLPLLGVTVIGRVLAAAISVLMLIGLGLSGLGGAVALIGGWFLVGLCCGCLMFLGTVAAARFATPTLAFTLRLGVVLVLAGACAALVQITDAGTSYSGYLVWLAVPFAIILAIGNILYAPAPPLPAAKVGETGSRLDAKMVSGLVAGYVTFVGQVGLVTYVLLSAVDRGIQLENAAWTFAAVKVGSGVWLIAASRFARPGSSALRMAFLGLLVATGGYGMSTTGETLYLFVFLIVFQIAFNSLSAQVQGSIAALGPQATGRWIACTLLLGAASGPPLHGWAIGAGLEAEFVAFAVSSALLPAVWRLVCRIDRPRRP